MKKNNPLDIDLFALHEEARTQSRRFKKASDEYANACNRRDVAESAMKLKFSELTLRINKKPGRFGLDKTTVDLVKAAAEAHGEYQETVAAYHKAKHEAQTLKGLVDAYGHRKTMIEKEVELWFGSYFASPKMANKKRERGKRE